MLEWLLSPIDPSRGHDLSFAVSWHARAMVLGWGFLAPLAVLMARFFKIMPHQKWPQESDNYLWWRSHWMGQTVVLGLSILGLVLVLPARWEEMNLHRWMGYSVLVLLVFQVALGLLRGSKGGPTAPASDGSLRGDHYDMTPRRYLFENLHKTFGYAVLLLSAVTIMLGLWDANGPRWMWLIISGWWLTFVCLFVILQRRGLAVDTYQAIWGTDPIHPGNRGPDPKWGMHRVRDINEKDQGDGDVWRDRGDRV